MLYFEGVHLNVGAKGMHWFVGTGIVLTLCGGLGSMFRTAHREDEDDALGKGEAFAVLAVLVVYLLILSLLIP